MRTIFKKILILLCILAIFVVSACTQPSVSPTESPEATPTPEATVEPTPEATVAPTPQATATPTSTPKPTPQPDNIVHMKEILESITDENKITVSQAAQDRGLQEAYLISDGYNIDRLLGNRTLSSLNAISYQVADAASINISLNPLVFTSKKLYSTDDSPCTWAVCLINNTKIKSFEIEDYEFSSTEKRARFSPKITLAMTDDIAEYLLIIKTTDKYEDVRDFGTIFINNDRGITHINELINSLPTKDEGYKVDIKGTQSAVTIDSVYRLHDNLSTLPFELSSYTTIARVGFKSFKVSTKPQLYDSKDILGADDGYIYAVFHLSSPQSTYNIKNLSSAKLNDGVLTIEFTIKGTSENAFSSDVIKNDIIIVKIPKASLASEVSGVKISLSVVK